MLTWQPWARKADVASGTSARMRRGTNATWQGRVWPTQGAGGADTWRDVTQIHAYAREGHHVAGGVGIWRAHGLVGPG